MPLTYEQLVKIKKAELAEDAEGTKKAAQDKKLKVATKSKNSE